MEYFRVYNRYGQLVYETREQGKGWNGTIGGIPQPNAAFVYNCKAIDYRGNPVSASGTFVLVR
jgi:gliding motility-associated-like protein